MRIGLALPQYDYSVAGLRPLTYEAILEHAQVAAGAGYDSLWLSDHLFLDLGKYGADDRLEGAFDPLVTLAALARDVPGPRLGTLVLCEALRPAVVLANALATLDRVCDGRLDVGIGAGWYAPEYDAFGTALAPPGERLDRLREAVEIVAGTLAGGPCTLEGRHHVARDARALPPPLQQPRPPVFVGGKGDRLLRLVAEHADGWNTCWAWTLDAYAQRLAVLESACADVGRDPATVWRSLGLYALCGEDDADLHRRWERLRARTPAGVLDATTLDEWRVGRLVGTVAEVRDQARAWADLGVETLVVGAGAVPFQVADLDDVALLGRALAGS